VTTGYSKEGGWPYGPVKDGDPIYKLEKELNDGFVIRTVSFILPPLIATYTHTHGKRRNDQLFLPRSIQPSSMKPGLKA